MSQDVLQDFGKNVVDRVLSIVAHVTVCQTNKRISTYFIFSSKVASETERRGHIN